MEKKRVSIPLRGVNTTMNDIGVPDGACSTISNLRYHNGEWIAMGKLSTSESQYEQEVELPFTYHIHTTDDGKQNKIVLKAIKGTSGVGRYSYYLRSLGEQNQNLLLFSENVLASNLVAPTNLKVTSFGNVLNVSWEESEERVTRYFVWKNGSYKEFVIPTPCAVTESVKSSTPYTSSAHKYMATLYRPYWSLYKKDSGEFLYPTTNAKNEWWGELCYIVAYRMKDGSLLSPSNMGLLCSEEKDEHTLVVATNNDDDILFVKRYADATEWPVSAADAKIESTTLRRFIPQLSISIPATDSDLIDSVALFCTRINPIYDFDKLNQTVAKIEAEVEITEGESHFHYADNKLPTQPFYLVDEKKLGGSATTWNVELDYLKLQDITTKPVVYKPIMAHGLSAETNYVYNSRVHMGDVTSHLIKPTISEVSVTIKANASDGDLNMQFRLSNGTSISAEVSTKDFTGGTIATSSFITLPSPIVSYPDYRCSSFVVEALYNESIAGVSQSKSHTSSFKMQPATANNFAYYIAAPTSEGKYTKRLALNDNVLGSLKEFTPDKPTYREMNRIQVTEINNPFSFPFANSYNFGNESSQILGLSTIADAQPDSTFYGAFPLYTFTSDGIFALRAGQGEVLYAGSEFVNHDVLINKSIISTNGSVVYATSEGLKALAERTAAPISADINMDGENVKDWSKCLFAINREFNELCVVDEKSFFVYSLSNGVWYQRPYPTGSNAIIKHLFMGSDILDIAFVRQVTQGEQITNTPRTMTIGINKESSLSNGAPTMIKVATRAIKFDSINSFKKIHALVVRFLQESAGSYTLLVEGSNDMKNWRTLKDLSGSASSAVCALRFPQSTRFVRIAFTINIRSYARFTSFDVEFMDKYSRQLR